MNRSVRTAGLVLSVAIAGCSDQTIESPGTGNPTKDIALLGSTTRYVVGLDGRLVSAPAASSIQRALTATAAAPTPGTTLCDQGALVPTNADPNVLFPEGGLTNGSYDNIVVPPGKICVLEFVTVTNSVTALSGSQLFIRSSTIGRNVVGLGAKVVQMNDETTVHQNVAVLNAGGGPFASCAVENSTVDGSVSCLNNHPGSPIIRPFGIGGFVTIGGSVILAGNFIPATNVLLLQDANIGSSAGVLFNGGAGSKSVKGNTVGNVLECRGNSPPFEGGPNVAASARGQCF